MSQLFSLEAYSCTLIPVKIGTAQKPGLLKEGKKYIIPIYQRPYAWGEKQLQDLFNTIFQSYKEKDACFLGTMQLIPNENNEYEVIDGQQRISTLLLTFKVINLYFPDIEEPKIILADNYLYSKVSAGEQQNLMDFVLNLKIEAFEEVRKQNNNNSKEINCYLKNAIHIKEILDAQQNLESENDKLIINSEFIDYLCTKIYFVVIETIAGLTKTIEIFKTINTSGMDLNGGNIFKIRMYEYLTKIHEQPVTVFNDIDKLYSEVDKYNNELKTAHISIVNTLDIYKYILIEKVNGNSALHGLSSDLFYERIFNSVLSNKVEKDVDRNKFQDALKIEDIERLVKMRYLWESKYGRSSNIHNWYHRFLCIHTRYGRYWMLDIVYLYCYHKEENFEILKFQKFSGLLLRYFILYSIAFAKAVNVVHTFCYTLIDKMLSKNGSSPDNILNYLEEKVKTCIGEDYILKILKGDISDNTKKRNLVCWLSAILEQDYTTENCKIVEELFHPNLNLDVEHIEPCNPDEDAQTRIKRQEQWKDYLNTIGNLTLLEREINRAADFSNKNFKDKYNGYKKSKLTIVKILVNENTDETWTINKCEARTEKKAKKILNFLFGKQQS